MSEQGQQRRLGGLLTALYLTAAAATVASGLLIAPLTSSCGLLMMPAWRRLKALVTGLSPSLILFYVFLVFAAISFVWSPYDDPEQIPKFLIGVPLYAVVVWRAGQLAGGWRDGAIAALVFGVIGVGLTLFSDALTGGEFVKSFKLAVEDAVEDPQSFQHAVDRSLGHSVLPLLLVSGPAFILLWEKGKRRLAGSLFVLVGFLSVQFGLEVNAVAFVLSSIATLVALRYPRTTLMSLLGGLAALTVLGPAVFATAASWIPPDLQEKLPLSWAWRVEIWAYTGELITAHPVFGHGLDASRTLNQLGELRGYRIDLLPLHPHNMSLQVWLETGLVGVLLLAGALTLGAIQIGRLGDVRRNQIAAAVWVLVSYVTLVVFSYGIWQEWHQGAVAVGMSAVMLLGTGKTQDG